MRFLEARGLPPETVAAKLEKGPVAWDAAFDAARRILSQVSREGDAALLALSETFDRVRPPRLVLRPEEFQAARERVPGELREALEFAARRIETFHRSQVPCGYEIAETGEGIRVGQQPRAIDRVGVYVPGGPRGYPSSVLMGVIPARLAGVREILVATPPSADTGTPPASVLAAASIAGADEVLVSGGAQAIAAMAYGTESVRRVGKIVGPGNLYVSAAKLLVAGRVATDGVAGPSEVLVLADASLPSDVLAAELLAQAEHDADAVAIAVLVGDRDLEDLQEKIEDRLRRLPRSAAIRKALDRSGWIVRAASVAEGIALANVLAPEHLVLAVRDAAAFLYAVRNAGCVFLGSSTTAALGDYTAGTNHVLPTAGTSRGRGGLSVRDFVKFLSYVEASPSSLVALSPPAIALARAEGFEAHAAALASRLAPDGGRGP